MEDSFILPEVHSDFRLNKLHFNKEALVSVAYSFIKEGEPYQGEVGKFLLDWVNDKDYVEAQTSGSTGPPKKILLKKQHMINSAVATGKFFELPSNTKALLCLPCTYIAGKMMVVRALVLGWHLDIVPPKANALDHVFKIYDFCAMTPFQLDNSLSRLHLIKKLMVGGGAVSTNLRKLLQGLGTEVFETYGMTETVTHIAARRIDGKGEKENPQAFQALPHANLSTDDRGCLVIEAPSIADEKVVTNDVVDLINPKKFLLKGRIDNVINSGGIKLYPEEIEAKLEKIIAQRFFITSIPDDALGEKVVLMVENEFSEQALENLENEIKRQNLLEKYEIPKKIYFVEKFEETPSGKVHRGHTVKSRMVN